MTIGTQGRTLFIEAMAAATKVPQHEIRIRLRSVSDAGLLPKGTKPFLAHHGVTILLAMTVTPRHTDAGRVVPKYLELPFRRTDRLSATVKRVMPSSLSADATLGSVLSDILRNKTESHIRELLVVQPPHESATIILTGGNQVISLCFGLITDTKSAAISALKHSVSIPSSVLAAAASAITAS